MITFFNVWEIKVLIVVQDVVIWLNGGLVLGCLVLGRYSDMKLYLGKKAAFLSRQQLVRLDDVDGEDVGVGVVEDA